jgi:hypothetical protein
MRPIVRDPASRPRGAAAERLRRAANDREAAGKPHACIPDVAGMRGVSLALWLTSAA